MNRLGLRMEYNTYGGVDVDAITDPWVDITAYVEWKKTGVKITRGRQDESGSVSAGRMTFIVNNLDGRFTPENAAGAYYSDITVPLWMRFTLIDSGTIEEIRFTGFVESWVPDVRGSNSDRWVQVTVLDPQQRISTFKEIESFLSEEIQQDNPIAYYPLTDGRGSTTFGDRSGNNQPPLVPIAMGVLGDVEASTQEGPPGAPTSTVKFTPRYPASSYYGGAYGKYLGATLTTPMVIGTGNAYTVEFWMLIDDLGARDDSDQTKKVYPGAGMNTPSGGLFIGGYYECDFTSEAGVGGPPVMYGSGCYVGQIGLGSNPNLPVAYGGHLAPGVWHHGVITSDGGNFDLSSQFYLNGHLLTARFQPSQDPPPGTVQNVVDLVVGGLPTFGGHIILGAVSHVAVYNTSLDSVRVLERYIAGRTGFAGEQLDYRMARILRYAGIAAAPVTDPTFGGIQVDTTPVVVQSNDNPIALIDQLVETGQGIFFFNHMGRATYLARTRRYTSPVLALSAAATSTGDIENDDLEPTYDTQRILNGVTTTSGVGTFARVVNAVSQALRGIFEKTISTVSGSPYTADETSRWVIAGRANPQYRIPSVTVKLLTRDATFQQQVLGARIWDRVTLTPPTGYAFGEQVIEGMSESYSFNEATIQFNLSPNAPQPSTVYQVGVAGADEINTSSARVGY